MGVAVGTAPEVVFGATAGVAPGIAADELEEEEDEDEDEDVGTIPELVVGDVFLLLGEVETDVHELTIKTPAVAIAEGKTLHMNWTSFPKLRFNV